jgi:Superinfection immunity protein
MFIHLHWVRIGGFMDDLFGNSGFWILLALYFTPTILAVINRSAALVPCVFVNLFAGWTIVGWFIASGLAYTPTKKQLAHRKKVKQATDDFYLREQEKRQAAL